MLKARAEPPTYTDSAMKIEAPDVSPIGTARARSLSWVRLLGLGAAMLALVSGRAEAAAPKRVGVVPFSGPSGALIQKAASAALAAHKYKIVKLDDGPAPDASPGED